MTNKDMKYLRLLFIFVLCAVIMYWSLNGFSIATGLIHDLLIGVSFFILLVANCFAGILAFNKKHKEVANRITLFSMGTFIMLCLTLIIFPTIIFEVI
ncbi:hypothetical protein CAI16_19545 [Virgibacillus dokdonensis]|uniref:Uncharacterized protein n=1 Tax=Virgibacillus dokdonensis TaxID=302167 RepID=A0A3E0WHI7_9BACI|nr:MULTISPECIES: hypothetical protein [Virgibacillus]RFA31909.1 hypothetical protein CAI16_19545 [Virgibacillus dokdonensis]